MNASDACPFCGTAGVVPGDVRTSKGPFGFLPAETKQGFNFTARRVFAFEFGPQASFCAHCNMVWSKASARDAADFIRKHGTEGLKAQFEALQQTPPPPPA
jgi:hypothetical protein